MFGVIHGLFHYLSRLLTFGPNRAYDVLLNCCSVFNIRLDLDSTGVVKKPKVYVSKWEFLYCLNEPLYRNHPLTSKIDSFPR